MPAWSFQPRFRWALLNGLAQAERRRPPYPGHEPKRQTIRTRRRDGKDPQPGQTSRLWIAQRTPGREFLGVTPPIRRRLEISVPHSGAVIIGGHRWAPAPVTRLAHLDALLDAAELFEFLEHYHGFPFEGFVYRW